MCLKDFKQYFCKSSLCFEKKKKKKQFKEHQIILRQKPLLDTVTWIKYHINRLLSTKLYLKKYLDKGYICLIHRKQYLIICEYSLL